VDIIRDGSAPNLHTGKYQIVAGKNGCEEEEVGLNWIIGAFVSNEVKKFGVFFKRLFLEHQILVMSFMP
jgi:hypothetical protein